MQQNWSEEFLIKHNPHINYLELYALVAGVMKWIYRFRNRRILLFCDNKAVVGMVNKNSTGCKKSMILIRMMVLKCLKENVRVFAEYVESETNVFADHLSRDRMTDFWSEADKQGIQFKQEKTEIPEEMWPMEKVWKDIK